MVSLLTICIFLLLTALFLYDASRRGCARTLLSHYWYFSLLWFVAFPLRALFIDRDLIDLQSELEFATDGLLWALLLAVLYWVSVTAGYLSVAHRPNAQFRGGADYFSRLQYMRAGIVVVVTLALGTHFLSEVTAWENLRAFSGNEQNEARVGSGLFFLTAELFVFATFPLFGLALADRRRRLVTFPRGKYLLVLILGLAVVMTVAIASRRVLASILFGGVLVYFVKRRRQWTLVPFLVLIGSVLTLPLFHILRYLDFAQIASGNLALTDIVDDVADARFVLTTISSSLEGVDHVARFLDEADAIEVFLGVDHGISWLFNAFLAYVPRFIWSTKPFLYGSVAQQHFLYPDMFADGPATTTLPPSFVVDFSFGFGVLFGLLMAFFLGRFFAACANTLWMRSASPARFAFALFVFVNVFNVLRGGTGFLVSVVLFAAVSCAALGWRDTIHAFGFCLREVLGFGVQNGEERVRGHAVSPT